MSECARACVYVCVSEIELHRKCPTLWKKVRRCKKRKSIIILEKQTPCYGTNFFLPKTKGNLNPKVSLGKPRRLIYLKGLPLTLPVLNGQTKPVSCVTSTSATQRNKPEALYESKPSVHTWLTQG